MASQKIRIKLKAYDHNLVDLAAEKSSKRPRKWAQSERSHSSAYRKEIVTVLRATHKYKRTRREQF